MMALLNEALGSADTPASKGKKGGAKKEETKDEDVAETCLLKNFDESHRNTHVQGGTSAAGDSEEEDDEGHHGQRVGCQTQ